MTSAAVPAPGSSTPVRMGTATGRWVLLATVGASSLAMLDATVVNVALAHIGSDLGADFGALQWIVNGYTLTLAALILLGGSLGDRFGRRRVFVIGTVWFAVASLVCAVAPNPELLVAARMLQGVGGALLAPGSLAIISASFGPGDRAKAVGAWSGLGGVAGAIGPFLGGWLVQLSWRAVFFVNLPFALVVVLVALRHVPESRDPDASGAIDVPGAVLAALGLAGITYALTAAGSGGASAPVLAAGIGGIVLLVAFGVVERRSRHPLVRLDMFRNAEFSAANLVTLLVYAALGVFFFLLVLQLQTVAGFSPLVSGTAMLPVTVLMLLLSSRSGALAARIGPRLQMTVGPLVAAAGFVLTLRIGPDASYVLDVLPPVILLGLGLSITVAPLTATVLDSADAAHAGAASGVNNAIARSAGLLSVAVVPVVAGLGGEDYTDPAAFGAGFRTAMLISAGLLVIGAVLALVTVRNPLRPAAPAAVPAGPAGPAGPAAGTEPAEPAEPVAEPAAEPATGERLRLPECAHCGVTGPQLHPRDPVRTP